MDVANTNIVLPYHPPKNMQLLMMFGWCSYNTKSEPDNFFIFTSVRLTHACPNQTKILLFNLLVFGLFMYACPNKLNYEQYYVVRAVTSHSVYNNIMYTHRKVSAWSLYATNLCCIL